MSRRVGERGGERARRNHSLTEEQERGVVRRDPRKIRDSGRLLEDVTAAGHALRRLLIRVEAGELSPPVDGDVRPEPPEISCWRAGGARRGLLLQRNIQSWARLREGGRGVLPGRRRLHARERVPVQEVPEVTLC